MESFLNRYRNITILLLVIFAQLVLLAFQVKNDQDVRFIRVWTVTAVSPLARIVEGLRGSGIGFVRNYIQLHDADAQNRKLQAEVDRLRIENIFLKNELNTAERAKALQIFQQHTPSKTLAASVISTGLGTSRKVIYVDRGTVAGVMRGMAVVTPDGILGKVEAAYPTASEVLLVTDPEFAAGVMTADALVHGTLHGQGSPVCKVDYIGLEDKLAPGDQLYTSGDDRIFPRGFPVGAVKSVSPGQPFKDVTVEPSGPARGLEDVLIILEGVHQEIPTAPTSTEPVYVAPAPPGNATGTPATPGPGAPAAPPGTEADRLRSVYKAVGDEQQHTFGEGLPGSKPPDFTKIPVSGAPPGFKGTGAPAAAPSAPSAQKGTGPPAGGPLRQ